jgi:hypothetical protein
MARLSLALLLLWIFVPGAAYAQRSEAPPGNSGVEEYLEVVPGGGGDRPSERLGKPSRGVQLSPRAKRALSGEGPAGEAAARAAESTSHPAPRSHPTGRPAGDDTGGGSRAAALPGAVTGSGSGGMRAVFPAILVAVALAAVGTVIVRRRGAAGK